MTTFLFALAVAYGAALVAGALVTIKRAYREMPVIPLDDPEHQYQREQRTRCAK